MKKVYFAYFGIKLGDHGKSWATRKVGSICVELRQWFQGKKRSCRLEVPMIWREAQNHGDDCYFCSCDVKGFNFKNKRDITYPNLLSAIRPVPHGPEVTIPKAPVTLEESGEVFEPSPGTSTSE